MVNLAALPVITHAELCGAERLGVLASLERDPYCCLVEGFADEPGAARTQLLEACSVIGRLRRQNLAGDLISEVRSGGDGPQRGARTTRALLWHTDSIFDGPAPEIVVLYAVRTAARGGLSRIITADDLKSELEHRHPKAYARLIRPFWFSRAEYVRPPTPPVVSAPILTDAGEPGISVLYNRARIQRGHHIAHVPLTESDRAALDAMDEVLESDTTPRIEMLVPAGTALLFSNRKLLHNRTSYEEDPHAARLLYRLWLDTTTTTTMRGTYPDRA
jgi:Taurine catabolism dioxygenase TauD, TfdA family